MRFVSVVAVLVAAGFATVFALANFVQPHTREMVVTIPAQRLKPQPPVAGVPANPQTAAGAGPAATR